MRYWIAFALLVMVASGLIACGDDDQDDTRAGAIGAASENAVDAWVERGTAGLHGYLAQSVVAHCTTEQLDAAIAGQPTPTAWRNTKDFKFQADDQATATVIFVSGGQDVEQTWSFVSEGAVRWRITDLPGLSSCGTS